MSSDMRLQLSFVGDLFTVVWRSTRSFVVKVKAYPSVETYRLRSIRELSIFCCLEANQRSTGGDFQAISPKSSYHWANWS